MLSSASGKMTVEGCHFINSVYSVQGGPTSGAQAEATCLTTSSATNNQLSIINNIYDNAGAIYVQTPLSFEGNTVIADKFMHYIQAKGSIGKTIDFSENTYQTGESNFVIIDTPGTKVLMPEKMPVIDYWVWNDTPEDQRPADYTDYLYYYNKDGSITYMPQSDVALEQFLNQNKGNKQVTNQDLVLIQKDLNLNHLDIVEDRVINVEIEEGASLALNGDVTLLGTLNVDGLGTLKINDHSKLSIGNSGKLNIAQSTKVENNGVIQNDGSMLIPESTGGTGKIEGSGLTNHYPNIMAEDLVLTVGDFFDPLKGVTATDQEDGEIKDIQVISNTVDTTKAGTYEVTYKATDSHGASSTKTIKVVVNEKTMVTPGTNEQSNHTQSGGPTTGIMTESNPFIPALIISGVLLTALLVWKKKKAI